MCGITGVYAFSETGKKAHVLLQQAGDALSHRGQDATGVFIQDRVGLAHKRHAVVALGPEADQPFTDRSGRYTIVYNGDIFNYKSLQEKLRALGYTFDTDSDTEVIITLYRQYGAECLKKLRGFFAFALYDKSEDILFVARDRYGEKPLYYYNDADSFVFGSELASLFILGVPRELDVAALLQYLQLTYVPAPATMLRGVRKLMPGHYLYIKGNRIKESTWYKLPFDPNKAAHNPLPYKQQKAKLRELLTQSVAERILADVSVGTFLSGGLDSSIVTALAAMQNPEIRTYAVGFPEQSFFDETPFARKIAQKYNTQHTEVLLTNKELGGTLYEMLENLSEPFADSSALAVYALSKYVGKERKVVLSGDGADELFAGYNKHRAEFRAQVGGFAANAVTKLQFLWDLLPKSRNSFTANKVRQMQRFALGARMSAPERYWFWGTWQQETDVFNLLQPKYKSAAVSRLYQARKSRLLDGISRNQYDLNSVLCADWQLVLSNDMLPKLDLMGMANGVEIRSPFLDHRLVKFVFSLPVSSKIDATTQKKILRETFKDLLPPDVQNRSKKGFEIPLLALLQTEVLSLIEEYMSDAFIQKQGIFDVAEIRKLRNSIKSKAAAKVQTKVWALLVFQFWWKKYLST